MADVSRLLETLHPMREPPPPPSILPFVVMVVLGCAAAAVLFLVFREAKLRRARNLRRTAEAALAVSRPLVPAERLAAQALLLRRLVRRLRGDAEARRQGTPWLASLDETFDTRFFTEGEGRAFGEALYRSRVAPDVDELDRSLANLLVKMPA